MGEQPHVYDDLQKRIHRSSDASQILPLLETLEGFQDSGGLTAEERYELQLQIFLTLKDLTAEIPGEAEELILQHLLPESLKRDPDAAYQLRQHRECLEDWLNQYRGSERAKIRDNVLRRLYPRLGASECLPACWLISRIGYRTEEAIPALWDLVKSDNGKVGNTALATLAALGPECSQREEILEEVHSRAGKGYKQPLAFAMTRLADRSSVDVVCDSWLSNSGKALKPVRRSIAVSVLSSIVDAQSEDQDLQDRVWLKLVDLASPRSQEFARDLYLGQIGPRCNSRQVVPTMLGWIGESADEKEDLSLQRQRIGLRLEECVRPCQLEGWQESPPAEAIENLRYDACQSTGHDGVWMTKEDRTKRMAWETLLRAGHSSSLEWFDPAVTLETSCYMQKTVMEYLSCFRLGELPAAALKWITEEYDWTGGGTDGRDMARRMAAAQMACSSASLEGFEALLSFGLHSEGKAMMQSVYALTEAALHLIRGGDTQVVDRLVETVVQQPTERQSTAAAYAIERVAQTSPSLLIEHVERLAPAVIDMEREPHERGSLITALGWLKAWQLPEHLVKRLRRWAREADRWIGGSSLEVLGHRGYLKDSPNLLTDILGLRETDERWDLDESASRVDWAPFMVGLLYSRYGFPFVPAIASLIEVLDWLEVPQVYQWLRRAHSEPDQASLPEAVLTALVQRARSKQTTVHSETEIFHLLAETAPSALVEADWSTVWDNWLPDSRVALANALGRAQLPVHLRERAAFQLKSLADDGQYEVRRASYRALSRQSMKALLRSCLSWSESPVAELRQRAAESCAWLDCWIEEEDSDAFEMLHCELVTDREKSVREAATHAREERRRRSWADQYLSIVVEVQGDSNKEILKSWCYGDALTQVGDDACIRVLREHISQNLHAPNVRYWLKRILEQMEENWHKTTQDWPEPWFAWEGTINEGEGRLIASKDEVFEVDYSIWAQPRSAPSDPPRSTWGGAAWPVPLFVLQDVEEAIIELEDGRQGRLVVRRTTGDTVVFSGTGPFPQ